MKSQLILFSIVSVVTCQHNNGEGGGIGGRGGFGDGSHHLGGAGNGSNHHQSLGTGGTNSHHNHLTGGAGGAGGAANQHLPGVDNRPGGHQGGGGAARLTCMKESNALLANPEIRNEISKLHAEVGNIDVSQFCTQLGNGDNHNDNSGERYDCIIDFGKEFGVAMKSSCMMNNGTFVERNQKVHCLGQHRGGKSHTVVEGENNQDLPPAYTWEFLNFPLCSGTDCSDADIDRLLFRNIKQTEAALQAHLNHAICKGDPYGQANANDIHGYINQEEESEIQNVLEAKAEANYQEALEKLEKAAEESGADISPTTSIVSMVMIICSLTITFG